ncbi:redoxin domain-containing protein [uncultured Fibrella sp.]|uniref:redoxin domain-containing protein n=1 Tax=uncultured Fibrella sp. TaxID=1284596 RepID=UPI0035CBC5B3
MKKNLFTPILFLLSVLELLQSTPLMAQTAHNRFTLVGTINRPNGVIQLLPLGGKESHPVTTGTYQTTIVDGHFTFTGEAPYPLAFKIANFPEYVSNPFIVEAGTQSIQCNADSIREIPRITNLSMRELGAAPVNFFVRLVLGAKQKRNLLAFATQHLNSYVGLWATVELLGFGYDPLLDSTYLAFAPSLKKSFTGAHLGKMLSSARIAAIGKPFPRVTLRTVDDKPVNLTNPQLARYTLVDFWYSHCGACIDQFPTLKSLFNQYPRTDFNIVQISTDNKTEVGLWKRTIQRYELPWLQYLDESGKFASGVLAISAFPSNFLLDQQGHIIRRDIRMDELTKFLVGNIPALTK